MNRMVLLVLVIRQHAEHDRQECSQTIEQQHIEPIELNNDDHARDEHQQTNGRARLNTGPVSATNPHTLQRQTLNERNMLYIMIIRRIPMSG